MCTAMLLLLLFLGSASDGWAGPAGSAVDVQIRSDSGRILPLYPVATPSANRKVYAEAVKGDHVQHFRPEPVEPTRRGGRGG